MEENNEYIKEISERHTYWKNEVNEILIKGFSAKNPKVIVSYTLSLIYSMIINKRLSQKSDFDKVVNNYFDSIARINFFTFTQEVENEWKRILLSSSSTDSRIAVIAIQSINEARQKKEEGKEGKVLKLFEQLGILDIFEIHNSLWGNKYTIVQLKKKQKEYEELAAAGNISDKSIVPFIFKTIINYLNEHYYSICAGTKGWRNRTSLCTAELKKQEAVDSISTNVDIMRQIQDITKIFSYLNKIFSYLNKMKVGGRKSMRTKRCKHTKPKKTRTKKSKRRGTKSYY